MSQDMKNDISNQEIHEQDTDIATKKPKSINPHIVILSVIAIVFAVVVFKLYMWNKGVPSDYDPDNLSDEFDIETLDVIFPLLSSSLEGHEDDGVTTILCLGNDPFSQNKGDENGLAELIASKTGATVYNGSFTGSCVTPANASYDDNDWIDAFSMPYLTNAICSGDFTNIKTVAKSHGDDPDFISTIEMLEGLDMNTVDIICIMYDGRDYIEQRGSDDPNNPYSIVAYSGALNYALSGIKETYPFIRIVVMSHTYCLTPDGESGDKVDFGNGTLSHYLLKAIDVAEFNGVSIIDNFYGTINEDNYSDYMTDYIHFNDKGRELLAQRFVDCIFDEE